MPLPSLSLKYPGESHWLIYLASGGFPWTSAATAVRTLVQIQPEPMATGWSVTADHCRSVTAARETGFYQDSIPHLEHNSGRGVVLPKYLTTGEVRSNQALQCSCLENPRDGEAWWAAVYGVTQSRTRLKQLSSSSSSRPLFRVLSDVALKYVWLPQRYTGVPDWISLPLW